MSDELKRIGFKRRREHDAERLNQLFSAVMALVRAGKGVPSEIAEEIRDILRMMEDDGEGRGEKK